MTTCDSIRTAGFSSLDADFNPKEQPPSLIFVSAPRVWHYEKADLTLGAASSTHTTCLYCYRAAHSSLPSSVGAAVFQARTVGSVGSFWTSPYSRLVSTQWICTFNLRSHHSQSVWSNRDVGIFVQISRNQSFGRQSLRIRSVRI